MPHLLFSIICLSWLFGWAPCVVAAGELASGNLLFAEVPVGNDQVLRILMEEVAACDFQRLMPEAPVMVSNGGAVANVTWAEAEEYARRLTSLNRRLGLLGPAEELRLPTVREWQAVASAPVDAHGGVVGLNGGLRELCRDTRTERFPSREHPGETVQHLFIAVMGRSDRAHPEEPPESAGRQTWIRAETRSPLIGFRLVIAPTVAP